MKKSHHPVGRSCGGLDHGAFARTAFGPHASQGVLQFIEPARIGDRHKARIEFARELGQPLHIAVCGERLDAIALAGAPHQIQRAVADGTGGTEHGDAARCGRSRRSVTTQGNGVHCLTKP